jgi:hypothetical protein
MLYRLMYVTCITIIDIFILYLHTNDAYTYDTYTPLRVSALLNATAIDLCEV